MDPIADNSAPAPFWNLTFIGGTADLDEAPHPRLAGTAAAPQGCFPLPMTTVGDRVWIVQIKGGHRMVRRLTDLGIVQGSEITVVSRAESGSVIVGLQGCRIGLGAGMAHRVIVTAGQPEAASVGLPLEPVSSNTGVTSEMTTPPLQLGALAVGQSGRILGYESGGRAYRNKLLAMGLTPGTHFTVTRQAPLGDPIEIEVRGYKLSLRKGEAATLQVEVVVG